MAAYYVKTLSDNLGYVTWIYYPAMGTLNCNPMFNNVLSIISVYGIRVCCNQIKYDYGRLVGISYLDHSENDMKYHYGATYDSWNRVRTMTYPDGEVVTYHYNAAGQIASVKSNKQGKEETIVEKVGYDKDGHTVYTKLGNGTETTYTYDKRRERLQEMNLTAAGTSIMHNKYQYDAVDNILGITKAVDPTRGNTNGDKKLGGAFKHNYAYDDLNRLVYASGKAKQASYSMQMTFGRMSEPLTKVQKVDSTKTAQSYDFTYKYEDSNHPTAPTQIGHEHYTYDANGNPTLVENDSLGTERRMYWDEDNRLMVLSDNGKTSRYTYNAAGERIIKSHGDLEGVYVNGAPQGITFHETEDYTIYPAPIITVTKNRFTKHYFIGDKRIASKLGTGKFNNVYGISGNNVTAGQKDYAARMLEIEKQREEYYKSLGTPPGVPTMKGATADPDNTGRGYNDIIGDLGDHSVPEGWVQRPKFNDKGDVPGPPIQWNKPEDPDNAQPGYGYVPTDTTNTEEIFFYHSDHLGSTSYITDAKANITQFDAYLPYGELLVDEHSSSEYMPYKFNGKELDQETGLYYYGARYMNPVTSLWYVVDAMIELKPDVASYLICLGNPITLLDPDGNWERNAGGNLVAQKGDDAKTYAQYVGISNDEALSILKNNGVTVNENGILSLKVGDVIENPNFLQDVIVLGKNGNKQGKSNSSITMYNEFYHLNIGAAIKVLNKNTGIKYNDKGKNVGIKDETQSIGRCAMYVRKALNAGGFDTTGHPLLAANYGNLLKNRGWSVVSKDNYKPEIGDIIVINSFVGRHKQHPSGHIQMYNGTQWVSDFKQRTLMPGEDYRISNPGYVIYRFNKKDD